MQHLNRDYSASLVTNIKSVSLDDSQDLIIEGYANTITKDRAGDVIPSATWNKHGALANYNKNPIVLAFHNHSKPIGKAIEVTVTELGLYIKAKISKGAGDLYQLIKDGILSTFSVGFMIKDAEYDSVTDTYFITDVELTEISVVSVPCNQDSLFSVAKSLKQDDVSSFKENFNTNSPVSGSKDENHMTTPAFDVDQFKKDLLNAATSAATSAINTANEEAAAVKRLAEAEATKRASEAAASKAVAREEAKALIAELQTALTEKDNAFAEAVKSNQAKLTSLSDEIAQLVASRSNPMSQIAAASKGFTSLSKSDEVDVDTVVMLGMVKNTDMFQTNYGKLHAATKAVNASSGIRVSSDAYETVFSQNLMRDIQAELVIAPLFDEITMTSANLTIPINPGRGTATWVDAANYGTDSSSGAAISVVLTERTLKTFKLAAKAYLTEETEEDAVIAVLPILRGHLVEAHASSIDTAFLRGTGTGQPKGLITQAAAIGVTATHATTANASVLVTAKMIVAARRKMGLYGIDINKMSLIISREAYWDLLLDSEWADVQQVNTSAVKLTGEVGNIYGMRVLVSDNFPAKANNSCYGVMVFNKNFVVPRLREVTVKTDMDIEKDRRVFVATQRLNLEPLLETSPGTGNGKGVVQITYAAA